MAINLSNLKTRVGFELWNESCSLFQWNQFTTAAQTVKLFPQGNRQVW